MREEIGTSLDEISGKIEKKREQDDCVGRGMFLTSDSDSTLVYFPLIDSDADNIDLQLPLSSQSCSQRVRHLKMRILIKTGGNVKGMRRFVSWDSHSFVNSIPL